MTPKEFMPRHTTSGFDTSKETFYIEKDFMVSKHEGNERSYRVMARGKTPDDKSYVRVFEDRMTYEDARILANNMNNPPKET